MQSVFQISKEAQSSYIKRLRILIQGDPAAPQLFNTALERPLNEFVAECVRVQWGFQLDEYLLSVVMFADNFWLFARTATMLQQMLALWQNILSAHSHSFPMAEVVWCSSIPDSTPASVAPGGVVLERRLRSVGFRALGSILTCDGRQSADFEHRLLQCEKAFWANKGVLCRRDAKIVPRLRFLSQIFRTVLFWGSGNWNLTWKQQSRLRGLQQRLVCKVVSVRHISGMDFEKFQHIARVCRKWKQHATMEDIVQMYWRLRLDWAGHLARISSYRSLECWTTRALNWRNRAWLEKCETSHGSLFNLLSRCPFWGCIRI